jgi:DNA-binding XRE family transcriptional regulator
MLFKKLWMPTLLRLFPTRHSPSITHFSESATMRAAHLIAEEMTLRELRRARKLSQERVAKELGIGQEGVSKIEKRADLMISTLPKTLEAMGGSLALVAQFPDSEPVILSGIAEDKPKNKPTGRKRAYAGA